MGLFGSDSFLGNLFGGTSQSEISNVPQGSLGLQGKDILLANFFFPQMLEFLQASSLTGQSGAGYDLLSKLFQPGAISTSADLFNISKEMSAMLPQLKEQAAQKQAANFQSTYDTLSKIPALSDIFSKAGGNVDSTGALANIFGSLSGAALGGAASSGFLTDPVKQNNVLGPLALQKYQIEQGIQQQAQAQALGLAGAGGLASQGVFGQNLGGPSAFVPNILNSAGLFGGQNLQNSFGAAALNTQLGQQMSQYNSALFGPIFGGSNSGDSAFLGGAMAAFL